mgnify:CR=1 FL=1
MTCRVCLAGCCSPDRPSVSCWSLVPMAAANPTYAAADVTAAADITAAAETVWERKSELSESELIAVLTSLLPPRPPLLLPPLLLLLQRPS